MTRLPDWLTSHTYVSGSNPAVPVWGFQRSSIASPFAKWLGEHVHGGLVELRLRLVYRRQFLVGPRAARSSHYRYSNDAERANLNFYDDFKIKTTLGLHGLYKYFGALTP